MNKEQAYDGALISELGVKRYLKATQDIKTSNIDFLLRGAALNTAWKECNFGCHGPSYRNLQRASTRSDFLNSLGNISPIVAGVVDGVDYQTIGQVKRLGGGAKRTAEGLYLGGQENFDNVGDENTAAYEFATMAFEKVLTFEVDVLDNPITQILMIVISEYTTALPEWLIEEMFKQGALVLPDKIDIVWLLKAASLGVIENANQENIVEAARLLNDPVQRLVGKQLGKKLAAAAAVALASAITKKILVRNREFRALTGRLVAIRQTARSMKGGLGSSMLMLLNIQGLLNRAAESSRQLQKTCPRLWNILRYNLNGANMVYFFLESVVEEYVDRLVLLEQNPREFGKMMEALIRAKEAPQIFFPGTV